MFTHILIPIAPPFLPKTALMTAAALSVAQSADLTLLYVADDWGFFTPFLTMPDESRARLDRFLGDASAIVSEYGAKASVKIARGGPISKVIKTCARKIGADAIFVGMPQRRNSEPESGDIAKALLDETDVPVLVIHESSLSGARPVTKGLAS
jgi:nucleotide-binding universal stress UspA family protein